MGVLYRREDLRVLQKSVRSILDQTCRDYEFLICDDGSSDEARAYLEQCAADDPRIRLVRPGGKYDLASKLNACLREAKGGYIARMDDDDRSLRDRLKKQIEALEKAPDIVFVGCNVSLSRDGVSRGIAVYPEYPTVRDFYMTQPFIHPALVFRRECLEAVGGYSENRRQLLCEDYDLLLRLYGSGYRGMNLQEVLLEYTIPDTAKGNRKMRHRWNEAATRWARFRDLGLLPRAVPFVVKPLAVGILPEAVLRKIKDNRKTR